MISTALSLGGLAFGDASACVLPDLNASDASVHSGSTRRRRSDFAPSSLALIETGG
jgi:hypothetical protein